MRHIQKYWLEILISISIILGLVFYQPINSILTESGMILPTRAYLLLEIIYDFAACMMLWYSGLLHQFVKEWRARFDFQTPILLLPAAYVRHVVWALVHIREIFKKAPKRLETVMFWFWVNRIASLTQPILTAVLVFHDSRLHWSLELLVLGFLLFDFASTIIIIIGVQLRIKPHIIKIRKVQLSDLIGILELDKAAYEDVGDEAQATPEMMTTRIMIGQDWFWVAEKNGEVVAIVSLMPTHKNPDQFVSWENSTDNGTIQSLDESGEFVYGVALTARAGAENAIDVLAAEAAAQVVWRNKHLFMFSARMPGYHRYAERMTPQKYYTAKRKDGKALDPQIRMYESFGFKRVRLVAGAFQADQKSHGYGVLFVKENPFYNKWYRHFGAFLIRLFARTPQLFNRLTS